MPVIYTNLPKDQLPEQYSGHDYEHCRRIVDFIDAQARAGADDVLLMVIIEPALQATKR